MYEKFYGLTDKPFSLTPDPDFLYLSRGHKEALAHLTYGVESKSGFVAVTGEVGAGKTTLLRTLIRNLGDGIVLSQVNNTRVNYKELLELILDDFGLDARGLNKTALLSELNDFLIEQYGAGNNCVLVVDEAQNLGLQALEGLRMLSNLETAKAKLLHIILAGQPGLRDLIDSPELEQLRQRITVRYHLGPMSPGEVGEYVRHRLAKVAVDPERAPLFPDEVIPALHAASGGIPRLVNVLADAALLHGYVAEARTIDETIVGEVASQLDRDQRGQPPKPEPPPEENADPEIRRRIEAIESRLESVLDAARAAPAAPAGAPELQAEAERLREREEQLVRQEDGLRRRAAELEEREREFNERLERVKAEWKKRMGHMQVARGEMLQGRVRFPPLKVFVFDPDPRIRNGVAELLGNSGVAVESFGQFAELATAVEEATESGWFSLTVVGADADDAENVARVSSIAHGLEHVPTVFLSDIDLSTVRRRIFSAGANYFIEKPNGRATSFTSHRESSDTLKSDLLRVVRTVERQYKAFFERYVADEEGR